MRPEVLFPLFAEVQALPGVGPRLAKLIAKAAGPKVADLIWCLPTGLVDRRYRPRINDVEDGRLATIEVTVLEHQPPRGPGRPWRVITEDETGTLTLVFFRGTRDWLMKALPVGEVRVVSGPVELWEGQPQMVHPDRILSTDELDGLSLVEPIYPLTQGLTPRVMQKAVAAAVARVPNLPEWQDGPWLKRRGWMEFKAALLSAHAPMGPEMLEPQSPDRLRLAFDELLANQLALALVRERARALPGRPLKGDGALRAKVRENLPYPLTGAQVRVLSEIETDLAEPRRMLRLLQGDVGAGKTIVAFLTLCLAIEAGTQGAIMAPTEILARQHYANLKPLADQAGVAIALLTGRDKGKAREAILANLASGETAIIIGTHALLTDDVAFKDLGLAIIDEQHKFGVEQRMTLSAKGARGTHLLVMTATPIPRTLALTAYGDMDVSKLDEKPPGRTLIKTAKVSNDRLDQVTDAVARAIANGNRVYWVCPLVEESEKIDAQAAEARYAALEKRFGAAVGLVHGKMKAADKDAVMAAFQAGDISILVATTVIEVGVDVPEASIMVIEHAERFGLAQLHQLRGRVGRGKAQSFCQLVYQGPLGKTAKDRLDMMCKTEDGFLIAEEDLRLRGPGDILGQNQSGELNFHLARLPDHTELLQAATDDARMIAAKDPELQGPRGPALRTLLYLFERDSGIRNLRSG